MVLACAQGAHVVEAVMLTAIGHGLAIEQLTKNLDCLGKPGLADPGEIEVLTDGLVLGEGVPCSDPDFEATPAQMVQAGEFLGQMDGVVKVVVQDERADTQSRRTVSDRHQGYEG